MRPWPTTTTWGGYCFEHNLLLAAVLEHIGFGVSRQLGRVQMGSDAPRPRTHMCLLVDADGERWLVDAGFGGETLETPIPLADDAKAEQNGWSYRVAHKDGMWHLQSAGAEGWTTLYRFAEERHHHVDVAVANHYTATHPSSHFVRALNVQHRGERVRHRLTGTALITTTPDGPATREDLVAAEVPAVLAERFALTLTSAEAEQLVSVLRGMDSG